MKLYYNYILLNPLKQGNFKYNDLSFEYEPFYIGKGYKDRVYEHYKGWYLKTDYNLDKKDLILEFNNQNLEPLFLILNENENETFVLNQEIELIKKIGRKEYNNGPLLNKTDGGDGVKGNLISNDTKLKLSLNNRWKNQKGKLHFATKPVYEYDLSGKFIKMWESVTEAESFRNKHPGNISTCCLGKTKTAYNSHWSYEYKGLQFSFIKPEKKKKGKAIIVWNNEETLKFKCIKDAVNHFNLKSNSIFHDVLTGRRKQFRNYKIKYDVKRDN